MAAKESASRDSGTKRSYFPVLSLSRSPISDSGSPPALMRSRPARMSSSERRVSTSRTRGL